MVEIHSRVVSRPGRRSGPIKFPVSLPPPSLAAHTLPGLLLPLLPQHPTVAAGRPCSTPPLGGQCTCHSKPLNSQSSGRSSQKTLFILAFYIWKIGRKLVKKLCAMCLLKFFIFRQVLWFLIFGIKSSKESCLSRSSMKPRIVYEKVLYCPFPFS